MKRILAFFCAILVLAGAALAQNSNTAKRTPKAPPPPPVDCSKATDADVTADVKAKLAKAPSLKDTMIDVAASAGVVTLTGTVKKSTQKGTATRVAKLGKCVKKVENKLTIEKKTEEPTMKPAPNKNAGARKPKNSNSGH
ncbi:MAG TPA: BON domain-containing protein [Blastocatellia bacterium]|nr:BON domain-containing protein [Blastocatellia bacterium]